jgi:hypothetical protein
LTCCIEIDCDGVLQSRRNDLLQEPAKYSTDPIRSLLSRSKYYRCTDGENGLFAPSMLKNVRFDMHQAADGLTSLKYLLGNQTPRALGSTKSMSSVRLRGNSNRTLQPQRRQPPSTPSPLSYIIGVTVC